MGAPGRATASATTAVVLILLGAATWAVTPVVLMMAQLDQLTAPPLALRAAVLLLGCLVGGATATSALPSVPRPIVIGAAALAAGVVLALPVAGQARMAVHLQAALLAAALAITAIGTWLGARMWPGLGRVSAAGFVQLAVITAVVVGNDALAQRYGTDPAPWIPMLAAMVAGGAITIRLLPSVTIGNIATSWLLSAVVTLAMWFLLAEQRFFVVIGVIATAFLLPFPIALASAGALIARRTAPASPLPPATAR